MERRFCSKCGKPVAECICNIGKPTPKQICSKCHNPIEECTCPKGATTGFGSEKSSWEETNRAGAYYIKRFDKIALIQGEVVVKQYHIGEFAKGLGPAGKGSASIIVTNKRVISKQDSDFFGSSSTSVEEITLDNIAGVKNYYSQGYTIWRLIIAGFSALIGLGAILTSFGGWRGFNFLQFLLGLACCGVAVYMGYTSRKPSYLFSIYASNTNQAMVMGANLRGKFFNSGGYGIMFQYKPTKEAVKMMCEIGACIVDLKQKGDFAIDAWKKA